MRNYKFYKWAMSGIFGLLIFVLFASFACGAAADNTTTYTTTIHDYWNDSLDLALEIQNEEYLPDRCVIWGEITNDLEKYVSVSVNGYAGEIFGSFFIAEVYFTNSSYSAGSVIELEIWLVNTNGTTNISTMDMRKTEGGTLNLSHDQPLTSYSGTNSVSFNLTINPTNDVDAIYYRVNYGTEYTMTNVDLTQSITVNNLNEGYNVIKAYLEINSNNYYSAFIVKNDFTSPQVTNAYPSEGMYSVSLSSNIVIDFDEGVDTNNLENLILLKRNNNPIVVNHIIQNDGTRVIMDPQSTLLDGESYTIFISNAVSDYVGNRLAATHSYTFSTLLPPLSSSPVFSVNNLIPITNPTNGTLDFRNQPPRLQWSVYNTSVYKYYVLIFNEPIEIQNNRILNKEDVVKYWTSDMGGGTLGNIDIVRNTYDMVSGVMTDSTNYQYRDNEIYYVLVYGVDQFYSITHSSQQLIFRW